MKQPGSPCVHCGTTIKAPRQHPSKCTLLWQLCVLHLEYLRHGHQDAGGLWTISESPRSISCMRTLEHGKGAGHQPLHCSHSSQPNRRGRRTNQGGQNLDMQQAIKALGRLALQQETAMKVLRWDTTWILLIQPGPLSTLQLLSQVGQTWKESQQQGAVNRPLRSVLITCLFEHVLKILQERTENAKNQGWLTEAGWQYQIWSASLGALTADNARTPLSTQDLIQLLQAMIPLLAVPYLINCFHANRAFKDNTDHVTAFNWRCRDERISVKPFGPRWRNSPDLRFYS